MAVRMLVLKPTDDLGANVECSLANTTPRKHECDLADSYTAHLTFGEARSVKKQVSIDACGCDITIKLEATLRHMRHPSVTRNL
jgi:hypothetical protein